MRQKSIKFISTILLNEITWAETATTQAEVNKKTGGGKPSPVFL
ncbi:MAG TPA: hypothetical protein VF596_10290 [Pyrinomonadaceae bacterium]|jgi:hypothetical protein